MTVRLKKISTLRNLRNFIDFSSTHELKRHEVFYAPNGSGKTNLTRILSALQDSRSLDAFKSKEATVGDTPELSITIDFSEITHLNYTDETNQTLLESLAIFNSDYVAENITVLDFKKDLDGDVVLELGKEDADIKKLECRISEEKAAIKTRVENLETSMATFVASLKGKVYKANEQNIWNELKLDKIMNISNSDKATSSVLDAERASISEADYSKTSQERTDLLALEGAEKINLINPNITKPEIVDIINALNNPKRFPADDNEISNNVKFLSTLLQEHLAYGKEPHTVIGKAIEQSEEKDKCILCKRALDGSTKDLFNKYKDFFEGEKAKLEEQLRKYLQEIELLITTLETMSNDKKDRVNHLAELFDVKGRRWAEIDNTELLASLKTLKETIEAKQKDLSSVKRSRGADGIDTKLDALISKLNANKKLADTLDTKSNDVATDLAAIRRKVGQMELANFIVQNCADLDGISTSNDQIKTLSDQLEDKQKQAPKKSVRKNTSELFNYFMSDRIGIDKYQSEIVNDQMVIKLKDFDISDSTHLISDGEQTIIGLAYFLASSISRLSDFNKFSSAVFIIDDPVSSVSYSNLFGISTLLQLFPADIKDKLWKENTTQISVQTIVLTHNIQFLNIMKTHVWKDKNKDKNHYGIIDSKSLRDIKVGRLLSEFQSALLVVYRESQGGTSELNVCNDIRRIAETLRHFYGLKDDFTADSMKKIFPYINDNNFANLFKVINHFSHGSPEDFDILPPNIVDSAIAEFVEIVENDQSPFIDLWNEVKAMEASV